ncbi:hypothetical protein E0E62_14935 [Streptomyces sp. 16-176A]
MRRRAAEERGDVAGQGNLRLWVARAGEHGPTTDTEGRAAVFNGPWGRVPSRVARVRWCAGGRAPRSGGGRPSRPTNRTCACSTRRSRPPPAGPGP